MTPELRRRLVLMLAGVAAMLVGLTVHRRVLADPTVSATRAATLGVLAGIAVAVFLWRTFTYFAARRRR